MEMWNGFRLEKSDFEGRELISVFPEKPNGKWALKTEYFGAFPEVEIELLKLGYHIFHLQNITRWYKEEDNKAKANLAEFVSKKYNLSKKCVVVGMSCGGMLGIYFGAEYPQYVSCMYLDAPVVNLLSCPWGVGRGSIGKESIEEFIENKQMNLTQLLEYNNQPFNNIPKLIRNNIPIILISGNADTIVPYDENGKILNDAYEESGCTIKTIIKEHCNHHPHGLYDNTPIVEFIKKYDI